MKLWEIAGGTIFSAILLAGAYFGLLNWIEVLAFITGAATVWLVVKQNIWNWPIGIANNIFFIVVFWNARLFADMGLQVVYIVLAALGWYWWLHGGRERGRLLVSRIDPLTTAALLIFLILGTYGLMELLVALNGSAPFLDSLTTVMSLCAQYLLTRKIWENWLVWIAADIIYIGLFVSRGLYLTAVLYAIFLGMCVVGLLDWRKSLLEQEGSTQTVATREAAQGA